MKQLGSVPSLAAKARFVPSFLEPNWKQAHRKTVCGEKLGISIKFILS
jgi:hypothetical protein